MATDVGTGRRFTPQLLMGLFVIAIGVLFTLDNFGIARARSYLQYWPLGLVAIGAVKLSQCRAAGGVLTALAMMSAGIWILLQQLGLVDVNVWQLWPVLLVGIGGSMVWRGLYPGADRQRSSDTNATVSAVAVLAGVNRGNNSRTFRGGDLTAVMGGCEIDLRQAAIDGEAVLDVFAMWGGIEIKVPEDWTVVGQVTPILGGFDDKTRPVLGAASHRLVIRGFAIMGGIEVKN
ncbi:MAG: DUF5668 domain-containing protein [Acidobacteriota bacterium]